MLSRELIAASTVPLVLSVLTEGDNYGYALIQRVRELSKERITWSEGMLYPVLHRMEREGLIESEWRGSESKRKRRYYRIRKKGKTALQKEKARWMSVHETLKNLWNAQPQSI
jgi:PadR family transcriptional regulator PadR